MWGHGLATMLGRQQGEKADRAAWDRRMGQHQETTEPVRPEGWETEDKSVGSDARLPARGQRRPCPSPPSPVATLPPCGRPRAHLSHCLLAADPELTCPTASLRPTLSSPVPTQARCCHMQSKALIRTNHFLKSQKWKAPQKKNGQKT